MRWKRSNIIHFF